MVNDGSSKNFKELFASKLYVLQTKLEPRFELWPRDVFLGFADFLWAVLLCICKETR